MHAAPARLAVVLSAFIAGCGCAPAHTAKKSDFPSPREAARLPMTDFAPSAAGPGLGAELVFSRGATLAADSLTLGAATTEGPSLAIVRWLGVTPGMVASVSFATLTTSSAELATASSQSSDWSFSASAPALDKWTADGTLLVAARNATATPVTVDLALTFTTSAALPTWGEHDGFGVLDLEEPSGIDYDFKRDRLWVVDDGGRIGRVNPTNGTVETSVDLAPRLRGPDIEGVRWVPGLDVLVVSSEVPDQLYVVSPASLGVLATATFVYATNLALVPVAGGDGFEGLAVTGVSGRTVSLVLSNQNDPHALYEATLTLPDPITGALFANVTAEHAQPAQNLSDVTFDWGSRRLLNVHGYGNDRLTLLNGFTETGSAVSLPLSTEGATFRAGALWSAQDLGGISATKASD